MNRKQQAGFTLIELVVVIIILGILAATALPKFVDLSTSANTAADNMSSASQHTDKHLQYANCLASGSSASTCATAGLSEY